MTELALFKTIDREVAKTVRVISQIQHRVIETGAENLTHAEALLLEKHCTTAQAAAVELKRRASALTQIKL